MKNNQNFKVKITSKTESCVKNDIDNEWHLFAKHFELEISRWKFEICPSTGGDDDDGPWQIEDKRYLEIEEDRVAKKDRNVTNRISQISTENVEIIFEVTLRFLNVTD